MNLADTITDEAVAQLPDQFNQTNGAMQTSRIQVVCRYVIAQRLSSFGGRNGILISLCPASEGVVGSSVQATAGAMLIDNTYDKYWFTKTAEVRIESGPGMSLADDGPATTPLGHTVSSSISISAGFFGDQPTGGATVGSSSSMSLPDFVVENQSVNKSGVLHHFYRMAATSGGAFVQDKDMFSSILDLPYDPPLLAKSNLPIPSQGFWVCDDGFNGVSKFTITVTQTLLAADITFLEIPPSWHTAETWFQYQHVLVVDWSQIKPPPH